MRRWAKIVRTLKTGEALVKFKDDNQVHHVDCDQLVIPETPALSDLKAKLLEENFSNRELFIPQSEMKHDWDDFVQRLGQGTMLPPIKQAPIDAIRIETRETPEDETDFR